MKTHSFDRGKVIIILLGVLGILSFLPMGLCEMQTLGTFKQNINVPLIQNCVNSTYSNISRIVSPNTTYIINSQTPMTKNGDDYNYTLTNIHTRSLGTYLVYGVCNENGAKTTWAYDFTITPSGSEGADNIVFIVFIVFIIYTISFIGFFGRSEIVTILGGMFMIGLSVYLINNGFIIYRDWLTNYFSYVTFGIGAFFAIYAGFSLISEDN